MKVIRYINDLANLGIGEEFQINGIIGKVIGEDNNEYACRRCIFEKEPCRFVPCTRYKRLDNKDVTFIKVTRE